MKTVTSCLPAIPFVDDNSFYPLDIFFLSEAKRTKSAIQKIVHDADFLQKIANGKAPATLEAAEQLLHLSEGKVRYLTPFCLYKCNFLASASFM